MKTKQNFSVRVRVEDLARIRALAEAEYLTPSSLVRTILYKELNRRGY